MQHCSELDIRLRSNESHMPMIDDTYLTGPNQQSYLRIPFMIAFGKLQYVTVHAIIM